MMLSWVTPTPNQCDLKATKLPIDLVIPRVRRCRQQTLRAGNTGDDGYVSMGDHGSERASLLLLARGRFLQRMVLSTASSIFACSLTLGLNPSVVHSLDAQRDVRTARPPSPALLLPVEKIRVAVLRVTELLEEPDHWEEARSLLQMPPLSDPEFANTLDRYSDSNWEKHILGDLYRNQGLESIKALKEITTFVQQQANGVAITEEDFEDVREAGRALLASIDDFLALAPPDDRRLVESLVKESNLNR